jgi:hypothetical protein
LKGTYNGQFYKNDGFTGNVFTNLGYKFAEGYRFGIDAGYFSSNVLLQGKNGSGIFSSYVLGKEFFKKAFTVSLWPIILMPNSAPSDRTPIRPILSSRRSSATGTAV